MIKKVYKIHRKSVPIPTFEWEMIVIFTTNIPKCASNINKHSPSNYYNSTALCITFYDEMKTFLIFNMNPVPGDIAHEAWHAVRGMLLEVNAELDNEVVAYHLGYLVDQIYDIKKQMRKKKNG